MNQTEIKKEKRLGKSNISKIILLILYSFFLLYLYTILITIEGNLFVVIITLIFLFLLGLGLIVSGVEKLSKLFHRKVKKQKTDYQRYKEYLSSEIEPVDNGIRNDKKISLEFRYRRPLLRKCGKCGMTLTSFAKKCPLCGKTIEI
ncbi:MAG: hypothetical protein ACXACC_02425 [Promethearchaeota archaeon]|jgi:hypothetical protein